MFKKSKYLLITFTITALVFITQIFYLYTTKTISDEKKEKINHFVKITTLPDLALSNEATFIRHRSISSPFETFKDDSSLLEYYPSTFIYTKGNR